MTSRSRIALAVAGLFLGAQIGMAALSELRETTAAEGAEQETVAEATAPELSTETPPESETAAPEAQAEAQPETQPEQIAEVPQIDLAAQALAAARSVDRVIPSSASESSHELLPAMIAYLDSRDTRQLVAGATGDVFPSAASEVQREMLPAMVAYFERREAALQVAESRGPVVASASAAQ